MTLQFKMHEQTEKVNTHALKKGKQLGMDPEYLVRTICAFYVSYATVTILKNAPGVTKEQFLEIFSNAYEDKRQTISEIQSLPHKTQ